MFFNIDAARAHLRERDRLGEFLHRIHRPLWRVILVLTDALVLGVAFLVAYWLRFEQGFALERDVIPIRDFYELVVWVLIPGWLVMFWLQRLYDYRYLLGGTEEYRRVVNGCTIGMMVVMTFSFLVPPFTISRSWLVTGWVLSATLVIISRLILRRIAYQLRSRGYFVDRAIIVGTNEEAAMLAARFQDARNSGVELVGMVEPRVWQTEEFQHRFVEGVPVLGGLGMLPDIAKKYDIADVIVATTALRREDLVQIPVCLAAYPDIDMQLSSGLYEILTTGMVVSTRNSIPLIGVNRLRLEWGERTLKSILDRFYIILSLPILLPVLLVIALLVRMDSPGPVLYRRRVLGLGGKEFDAWKFRSMYVNGDEILEQYPEAQEKLRRTQKLIDDPRVTKVGKFLRRTSLDELPQLINVMMGQMSLVGPRMVTPEESHMYGNMGLNLLTVKPGMTGMWQVSGRSDLTYDERIQLDMYYIRNYSVWLDLQILFIQTPPAVLRRRGAY